MNVKKDRPRPTPRILTEFLAYMSTIKGASKLTIKEYSYDLNIYLKYIKLLLDTDLAINDENIAEMNFKAQDRELLERVSLEDLYSYLAYLDEDRNNAPRTRGRKISSLRTFYDYLHNKIKAVNTNPTEGLENPSISKQNPVYLTLDECHQLLNAILEGKNNVIRTRDYCMVVLFLNCGIRLAELVSIDLDSIKDDMITIIGKGNKERVIYLNNACLAAIDGYLKFRPHPKEKDEKALFLSERRKRISVRAVQYRVEKYIEAIGLDTSIYSVHKLRHTAATLLYRYGNVDIRTLQDILGHESVGTTQIYTHLDDESLRTAVGKNPLNN